MKLTSFGLYSFALHCVNSIVDRGWFGLTPLDRHIVICGCPRAGTTLLHLMLSVSSQAKVFGRERRALDAARRAFRNHASLLTKRPNDVFELDAIRSLYQNRRGRAFFLINIRDPRDILVSKHSGSLEYYVTFDRWNKIFAAVNAHKEDKDVFVVRFENLIGNLGQLSTQIEEFTELPLRFPLEYYNKAIPKGFEISALNGVRLPDPNAIGRWRGAEHRKRIQAIIAGCPNIAEQLIAWGYEEDDRWIQEYVSFQPGENRPNSAH